jgi:hypothetical protein
VIPENIASAVRDKDARDQVEYNKLVAKGTPIARMNTGIDGGMNKIFASKIPEGSTGLSENAEGSTLEMLAMAKAPGTIPGHVNPPKPNLDAAAAAPANQEPVVAVSAPAATTRVAAAAPASEKSQEKSSGGFFSNLGRKMGLGTADTTATTPPPQATASVAPTAAPATPPTATSRLKAAVTRFVPGRDTSKDAPKPAVAAAKPAEPVKPDTRLAATRPALKPSVSDGASEATQIMGAAPVVSSNSFDSRFGAVK